MLRILLTIHHDLQLNSGAPGSVARLADEYRRMGHIVKILSFVDLIGPIHARLLPVAFPWLVFRRLQRMRQRFDVVDASSGDAWVCLEYRAWRRRAFAGTLFVTHSHGLEHLGYFGRPSAEDQGPWQIFWKWPLHRCERRWYQEGYRLWEVARSTRGADLALFLNRQDMDFAIRELGVARERARLAANGISAEFLRLPFGATPAAPGSSIRIAQVGRYTRAKGVEYGARALASILKHYPDVRVSFLGTGCSADRVRDDFEPELHERVHVVPQFENAALPDLLQNHQIKLFPTLAEGFGLALLEAMSCGLVPVATSVPGPLEIVRDGLEGLIVPPRDSSAIEHALCRLLEDRTLLDNLRRNAHAAAQRYSLSTIAAARLALYEEFLSKMRRCGRAKGGEGGRDP